MDNKENTHTAHFFKGRWTTRRIMTLRNTTFGYATSLAFWVLVTFLWHGKNYWVVGNGKKPPYKDFVFHPPEFAPEFAQKCPLISSVKSCWF